MASALIVRMVLIVLALIVIHADNGWIGVIELKQRRTRKEQSRDRQQHYGGLAEKEPDAQAAKRFVRKAYSSYGKTEKAEVLENDNGRI